MTDKQIIIDCVNVSGCPFFEDERKLLNPAGQELNFKNICSLSFYNFTDFDKDFLCNQSPNCYYKQLKRKEQECETLASLLDFEVQKKECLEQECERLNNIINEAKNSKLDLKSFLVGEAIQKEYEQQLDQLKAELEAEKNWHKTADEISKANSEYTRKLKQAIEKIKELIQKEINDCEHCDDCASCEYNCCTRQILQICDEVNQCENQ